MLIYNQLPEKKQNTVEKGGEIVVSVDLFMRKLLHFTEQLHANDRINEEEQNNQQDDVGKSLLFEVLVLQSGKIL